MSDRAPIIRSAPGEICFAVDDVQPASDRLPLEAARANFEHAIGTPVQVFSHPSTAQVVHQPLDIAHPLAQAVQLAFSQHRPLILTPDAIWLTIAQGFAQHVTNHAEDLRSRFVKFSGKITLEVMTERLTRPEHWAAAIDDWALALRHYLGDDLYRMLICDFTTTTPIIRTASQVVLMDAFQRYFDFQINMICGIPTVTLLGTVADWRSVVARVRRLNDYDLDWWTRHLLPICEAFVDSASGRPSREFWQQIYQPQQVYGGQKIVGWLGDLFPYLKGSASETPRFRNPRLARSPDDFLVPPVLLDQDRQRWINQYGLDPEDIPIGLSQVPLLLKRLIPIGPREETLDLLAGFIGVSQQPASGALAPEIGWAVRPSADTFAPALAAIKAGHITQPPVDWHVVRYQSFSRPKAINQMLEQFDGATLFADTSHPWRLRALSDYAPCQLSGARAGEGVVFMDLSEDRSLAYVAARFLHAEPEIVLGRPVWQAYMDLPVGDLRRTNL